jgi:multiple sugar transport system permease protein
MNALRGWTRADSRRTLVGLLWISPWLLGSGALVLLPMAMSFYYSLTDYPLLEPPLYIGFDNYRRLWHDPTFWRVVRNTALFAAVSVPVYTLVALALAGVLASRVRFARFYQACIFLPTLTPLIAAAMVWMWLFNGEYGLINRLLAIVGVRGPTWLVDPGWVMPSLVIMSVWGVGQAMVIYIAAMQDVPRSLYEAARLDGMGPIRQFLHVTLPMISPAILFNVISLLIAAVQVFAVPFVMFRRPDGQHPQGHFYSMYLYENAFIYGQMGYASAMAWVQLLVVLALTGVLMLAGRSLVHYTRV